MKEQVLQLQESPSRAEIPGGPAGGPQGRVTTAGKFLSLEGGVYRIRGVTYGTFKPRAGDGQPFPEPRVMRADFRAMARLGINTVRTYTVPPPDLIELASEAGLRVIAGLYYHDWREEPAPGRGAMRRVMEAAQGAVKEAMERCAGRHEVLAIAVGNEIPADVVRLHGAGRVQAVLSAMIDQVHEADPHMLATYCNYPTTEFLQVAGQDFASFNVFLENRDRFNAYLRHLHVVARDLPLVVSELGLASEIHGEAEQEQALSWQLESVEECGCAGAMVFAWTDEWTVGGREVTGWGFGLHDAGRHPRVATRAVSRWARAGIRDIRSSWPRLSVVVCAYNAQAYIGECLASLFSCDYPDLEVIVCDDGSTDGTREVAQEFPVRLLPLTHVGLSNARNAGIGAASSEIVAFLDADAACHPEWPFHMALAFEDRGVVGAAGPNLPVPGAGFVERAVARCPGNPVEVLLTDNRAEHLPGCNMAFRKDPLMAVGGFDPVYTTAGDDVDVSWKLLDRGHELAFAPAAQVWHHRRPTVRGFLRQQVGYGRAERLLYGRHRHRFNRLGQARWSGFIYGQQALLPGILRPVVYHGPLGLAPFQPVVRRPSEVVAGYSSAYLPLSIPVAAAGLLLAALFPQSLALTALACLLVGGYSAAVAAAVRPDRGAPRRQAFRLLVAFLHVVQPLARTWGRVTGGRAEPPPARPAPSWTGDRFTWLMDLRRELLARHCGVRSSDSDAESDLTVWLGAGVRCHITTAVVWQWRPVYRLRFRPSLAAILAVLGVAALALTAGRTWELVLLLVVALLVLEASALSWVVLGALRRTTRSVAK